MREDQPQEKVRWICQIHQRAPRKWKPRLENGKFSLRIWSAFDHCITPVIFHAMPDLLAIIAQWQEGWGENVHNSTQHLFQSFD